MTSSSTTGGFLTPILKSLAVGGTEFTKKFRAKSKDFASMSDEEVRRVHAILLLSDMESVQRNLKAKFPDVYSVLFKKSESRKRVQEQEDRDGEIKADKLPDIMRPGKSIKVGSTWFTISHASSRAGGVMMATADWELERGKKPRSFIATYDTIVQNVKSGKWDFKWDDKFVGVKGDVA